MNSNLTISVKKRLIFAGLILFLLLIFLPEKNFSQVKIISGKVVSTETKLPIIGAEILIKGTKDGTITDLDGEYSLSVVQEMELVLSASGFKSKNILIKDQATFEIELEPKKSKKNSKKDAQTTKNEASTESENNATTTHPKKNIALKGYCYGKVIAGDTGWELLGVQVLVNGKGGTITDLEGYYEIKADSGDVLSFSLPGFTRRHRVVQNYTAIDVMLPKVAKFPGGHDELTRFISRTLKYPADAMQDRIEGKVNIDFVINEDGSISEINVSKGVHPSLDAEAIRIIMAMPIWEPAYFEKKPIKSQFNLPISFSYRQ